MKALVVIALTVSVIAIGSCVVGGSILDPIHTLSAKEGMAKEMARINEECLERGNPKACQYLAEVERRK